jgi:phenylacetate-CoA ligase
MMADELMNKIYQRAPIWLQDLMVSLKGWEFRYRRENHGIKSEYFQFLLKSEHWDAEQFRQYQGQQLHQLLETAFTHIPYYRGLQQKLKCEPGDFKVPEDIRLLPILEKSQVRGREHLFINESINIKKCQKGFTSGTTGTPLNFYFTPEAFARKWAFVDRLRHWAGLKNPHLPRRAQFTGRNIIPLHQDRRINIYWRRNIPGNALLFSTTHLSPETAPFYARALHDFQPEFIDGYPSALLVLAKMSRRLGLKLPSPKAIIVSAETLWPEDRREIAAAFQCNVYDQYSASEPSIFWCDCEYGVMHENPESGISEIVDSQDNPVVEGGSGTIVSTFFWNPAMILIRYRLGDMAIRGTSTLCQCGRAMPRIEKLEGRVDDILFVPERGYVGRLDPVFKGLDNIIEAQIIQEDFNQIIVKLVPDAGYNEAMNQHFLENMRSKLGLEVKIIIETVSEIQRGPNGKFNSVMSKVKHLYPDKI